MITHISVRRTLLGAGYLAAAVAGALVPPASAQSDRMQTASAASDAGPRAGQHATGSALACADQRDWVDAERTMPGVLLTMAQDSLAACQAKDTATR